MKIRHFQNALNAPSGMLLNNAFGYIKDSYPLLKNILSSLFNIISFMSESFKHQTNQEIILLSPALALCLTN